MSDRVLRDRATIKPAANDERTPAAANLTKEAEAQAISDALNRAIRLHEPFDDDNDGKFVKSIYDKNIGDIRLLVNETASSCWSPGFSNMVKRCIYVRSQPELVDKEVYRTKGFKCVACGRWEHCNPRTVDVFGFMKQDEDAQVDLLLHPANDAAYQFEDIAHWLDGLKDTNIEEGQLARFDLGRLTMGETCHARFKLVMELRVLMFDKYLSIRDEIDERTMDGTIEAIESKLYGDSVEDANDYLDRRAALELAITKMEPPFPPSQPVKAVFDLVDLARAEASVGDDDALHALLRRRTHLELGSEDADGAGMAGIAGEEGPRAEVPGDEDDDDVGIVGEEGPRAEVVGDENDDVGSPLHPFRRRRDSPPPPPRRRSRVIDEEDDDAASPLPRRRRDSPPLPPRRCSRVIDEDDDDDEEEVSDGGGGGDGVPDAAAQARDRRAPRAVGRLPSRHKAIINALRLAAALQAQGHTSESATVTNLVATCQELLDQF